MRAIVVTAARRAGGARAAGGSRPVTGRWRAARRRRGDRRQLPRRLRARGQGHARVRAAAPARASRAPASWPGWGRASRASRVGDRVGWNNAPGSYAERVLVGEDAAVALPGRDLFRGRRGGAAAGLHRALPRGQHLPDPGRRLGDRACRGGRRRAAADADRQAARRARDRDDVERREGRAGPRRRRRRDDRLRRASASGRRSSPAATACTRSTTASGRRRSTSRWQSLRPRGSMVLYGAASGPPPPVEIARLNAEVAVPHPADARPLRPVRRRAAPAGGRGARVGRGGRARRPDRRALPARGGGARAGRPRVAADDGEADPHAVDSAPWCCGRSSASS